MSSLIQRFNVTEKDIKSIITKMIYSIDSVENRYMGGKLQASWDQVSNCLVIHRKRYNQLESITSSTIEKTQALTEQNEKLYDPKYKLGQYNAKKKKKKLSVKKHK